MTTTLIQVTKDALELPLRQRLTLAGLLLESDDSIGDPDAESAWAQELEDRIQRIDVGVESGISFEKVMQAAQLRLIP